MNKEFKQSATNMKIVRVSKEHKKKLRGTTNWLSLIVEEKKEGFKK